MITPSSAKHGLGAALRARQILRPKAQRRQQSLEQQLQSLHLDAAPAAAARATTSPITRRHISTTTPRATTPAPVEQDGLGIVAAPELNLDMFRIARHARPLPVSPSYFTRAPRFYDSFLQLEQLMRDYGNLPTIPASEAQRVSWKTRADYRQMMGEPFKATDFARCMTIIKRLHLIHPDVKPPIINKALEPFKRDIQAFLNVPKPIPIDKFGRTLGVGRRKSSTARAWVVEGTGEVLINGKPLAEFFGRIHDRESAVWSLHATGRLDKYNVWALVEGGGTTGQAEALTLAIAKALVAHEPALKTTLRKAGCISRDVRTVERKKTGHVKARKMPAWVKR